jgi:hypothetical protein
MPEIANVASGDIYKLSEQPKGMSLAEMLNITKSNLELQKAKELYQPSIEAAKAQSRYAQAQATEAEATLPSNIAGKQALSKQQILATEKAGVDLNQHYANISRGVYGGLITDPDFINGNSKGMVKKLENAKKFLQESGVPIHESSMHDQLLELAKTDPKEAYQMIKNGIQQSGGTGNQFATLQTAQPPAIQEPPKPVEQARVTPQTMSLPEHSQPVQTPYPVRNPSVPYAPMPTEKEDQLAGNQFRNNLVTRQSNLTTDRRNIDEVIDKATELKKDLGWWATGAPGAVTRNLTTFLGTDTGIKYKELSKDLANAQMANTVAQGGSLDSVEGLRLKRLANGDETYPPDVLIQIAQRTKADMTGLDMQATAVQKFANRFGDNNMKKFQQEWSKNADTKIFQVINLAKDTKLSAEEKQKAAEKLLGPVGSEERKIADEKYKNLLKLQQNGTLQ